ncbi:LIM domain-containing protein 1-like [Labrus mixtus]|uniref:LIM domain-containing protein 1-like n=1 Tax=Labrus mixtus TaxID=508554 RepID=UPI0029C01151|nr:LIM domain-containing protein 1-like [Labrus mixtus]
MGPRPTLGPRAPPRGPQKTFRFAPVGRGGRGTAPQTAGYPSDAQLQYRFPPLGGGQKLSGKSFHTVSGRIYCEDDFLYSGVHPSPEVCHSCGCLITDLVLQARGKSYHPSCFCRVVCRRSLEGQPFSVDADSRVYCVTDYHKVQARVCAACREPILPTEGSAESIRVVSYDRSYHVECYSGEVNLI